MKRFNYTLLRNVTLQKKLFACIRLLFYILRNEKVNPKLLYTTINVKSGNIMFTLGYVLELT